MIIIWYNTRTSGQGLPKELGKYIWLTEADTSQEAPTSKSGSSSLKNLYYNLKILWYNIFTKRKTS